MGRRGDRVIDLRDAPDDIELVRRVRAGDEAAYGELWARHAQAARRTAARLVPRTDVDDLVSEAFERTLAAIRSGNGPETAFFPYVARTLRGRAAALLAGKGQVTLANSDDALDQPVEDDDPFAANPARDRVLRAFRDLPPRWQDALWVSVVEAEPPRRVAERLGTSPNGVSALVLRARRRLRSNFIDLSAVESRNPMCSKAIQTPSRHGDHLRTCDHCAATLEGLAELDVQLHTKGVGLLALLGGLGGVSRLRELVAAAPAKAAVAVVAVTAAGAVATPFLLPGSSGAVATRAVRPPAVIAVQTPADPVRSRPQVASPPTTPTTPPVVPPVARPVTPPVVRPAARVTPAAAEPTPAGRGTAPRPVTPPPGKVDPLVVPAGWSAPPVGITIRTNASCWCARVHLTGLRVTDMVRIRVAQGATTRAMAVLQPSHGGQLTVLVAGDPGERLAVDVKVVRAHGQSVASHAVLARARPRT